MRLLPLAFRLVAVLALCGAATAATVPRGGSSFQPQVLKVNGGLPLGFENNAGQAATGIDFVAHGRNCLVLLAPAEITLAAGGRERTPGAAGATLRMQFLGANPKSSPWRLDPRPASTNYLLGNDPARWLTHIETYAKVGYREAYPGIDIVYYGNQRRLEFDLIVKPGADPRQIALDFAGANRAIVDAEGGILLQIADQVVLQLHKPVVYQNIGGARRNIAGHYVFDGQRLHFDIAHYDATQPLVIDPVLSFATRLGGGGDDAAYAIAADAAGDIYVTGDTTSPHLPRARRVGSRGADDAFVAKLSGDGARLIYMTYLGGSGADVGFAIAVDTTGNAYVTGDTRSPDFPTVNPLQPRLAGASDVFVAKLSADGAHLLYSTYVGGSSGERGLGIAVDAASSAIVTGYTHSPDFPTANAVQQAFGGGNADAFAFKLNPSGSAFVYSTYLGGSDDRADIGNAIAVDLAGNAYLTGLTNSPDFPVRHPVQTFLGPTDVFVAKLDPAGALVYSTFLGGKAADEGIAIAVDAAGSAYVAGHTESPDFPTTAAAFRKECVAVDAKLRIGKICVGGSAFISKLNADGSALVYSTYLNGNGFEMARAIAVDSGSNAYVTGLTTSTNFPAIEAMQPKFGGGDHDAFVVKLDPAGAPLYSTYLGGSGDDGGYGIAIDPAGDVWVAGYTTSADFPQRRRSSSSRRSGARRAFVVKITEQPAAHH